MPSHRRHRERQESLQIQGFGLGRVRFPPACCPIRFEEPDDVAPHPDGRKPAEAQVPLREELEEAQEQVYEQPRPDLPLVDERDGVAPGREHAREVLRRGRGGGKDVRRNEVDNLP